MLQGAEGRAEYILYSNGRRRPPRRCKQFTDERKHLFRRNDAGIPMAFLSKNAIFVVCQALPSRNVWSKYRSDRVGAVRVASSRTVWGKMLVWTSAEKMGGKTALDSWEGKMGQKLLGFSHSGIGYGWLRNVTASERRACLAQ